MVRLQFCSCVGVAAEESTAVIPAHAKALESGASPTGRGEVGGDPTLFITGGGESTTGNFLFLFLLKKYQKTV